MRYILIVILMMVLTYSKSSTQDHRLYFNSIQEPKACKGKPLKIQAYSNDPDILSFQFIAPNQQEFGNPVNISSMNENYKGYWHYWVVTKDYKYLRSFNLEMIDNNLEFVNANDVFNDQDVCAGGTYQGKLEIKNNGDYAYIEYLSLKDGSKFKLKGSTSSLQIYKGSTVYINIQLDAEKPIYYKDELIVDYGDPCNTEIIKIKAKAERSYNHLLSIMDTVIQENDPVSLPIKLKLDNLYSDIDEVTCKLLVEYDPEVFIPDGNHIIKRGDEDEHLIEFYSTFLPAKDTILLDVIKGSFKPNTAWKHTAFHVYEFSTNNGCAKTEYRGGKIFIVPVSGIENNQFYSNKKISSFSSFSTFPNPANDYVTVEIKTKEPGPIQIQIIDMLGNVIDFRNILNCGPVITENFELKDLSSGIIFIKVLTPSGVGVNKIIRGKI